MGFKIKIKKISIKDVNKAFKKAGDGIKSGVLNSAKGIASAGNALGKCRVGDVKCAAKGMTKLATSVAKMAIAVSPGGVAINAVDAASDGKLKKGLKDATKSIIGIDPNDLASGDPAKMAKSLGKVLYKVSGAETAVTAAKALAKCKPKDAKCIAMNLGQLAAVAAAYIPGAGGAAAVAMKLGQNAVKNAVKNEIIKEAKKRDALNKLKAAVTPAEKKVAQELVDKADKELTEVMKLKADEEKKLNEATIVLASQTAAKAAQDEIDKAKKNPEMKDIAAGIESKINKEQVGALGDSPTKSKQLIYIGLILLIIFILVLFFM